MTRDTFPAGVSDSVQTTDDEIATITLQTDDDGGAGNSDAAGFVSGLLNSGRDPYLQAANFSFSAARFRLRGYDNALTSTYINGVPMNDLLSDRTDFRDWRGLNDVTRARQFTYALGANENAFGNFGGTNSIDTRASSQRKQTRASYAVTNRSYRNRAMITHNSGLLNGGWAYSLSASHSWAQEGFIEGTFFDGYAYFASVDKILNKRHALNITTFGSPAKIGRSAPTVQYMYDVANNNFYNPLWGFQNGEKRNSRVDQIHQPVVMLRHDWTPDEKTHIVTSASFQSGRNGRTGLDWYQAQNPLADYYLKLPYAIEDPTQAAAVEDLLSRDQSARQLDWDNFYNVNRANVQTVEDFDGTMVTGKRAQFLLQEFRTDSREANLYSNIRRQFNDRFSFQGGLSYQYYKGLNFVVAKDLLGADYFVDLNRFALRNFAPGSDAQQNDLNRPNRLVKEGERYSFDFDAHVRKASTWGQLVYQGDRLEGFVAASASRTSFWRVGNTAVGLFPDNSFGESVHHKFINGGVKGGLTWKMTGRHVFYGTGMYQTLPPQFRDAFVSPRTRHDVVANLTSSTGYSGEAGYMLRLPRLKGKISAYYTQFDKLTETRTFYHDDFQAFVNFTLTDMSQLYRGVEAAVEYKIHPRLLTRIVGTYSRNTFNSRPNATISQDNNAASLETREVYLKNFYVPNSPQQVYNASLRYEGKKFWFANLTLNYFADTWTDINYDRRTLAGISYDQYGVDRVLQGSELWYQIIDQERLPNAYTVDLFVGKSYKLKNDQMLYLNVGVNNLTNNVFKVAGFEQLRFDYEEKNVGRFPNRYTYAQGANYFVSLSWRL